MKKCASVSPQQPDPANQSGPLAAVLRPIPPLPTSCGRSPCLRRPCLWLPPPDHHPASPARRPLLPPPAGMALPWGWAVGAPLSPDTHLVGAGGGGDTLLCCLKDWWHFSFLCVKKCFAATLEKKNRARYHFIKMKMITFEHENYHEKNLIVSHYIVTVSWFNIIM